MNTQVDIIRVKLLTLIIKRKQKDGRKWKVGTQNYFPTFKKTNLLKKAVITTAFPSLMFLFGTPTSRIGCSGIFRTVLLCAEPAVIAVYYFSLDMSGNTMANTVTYIKWLCKVLIRSVTHHCAVMFEVEMFISLTWTNICLYCGCF